MCLLGFSLIIELWRHYCRLQHCAYVYWRYCSVQMRNITLACASSLQVILKLLIKGVWHLSSSWVFYSIPFWMNNCKYANFTSFVNYLCEWVQCCISVIMYYCENDVTIQWCHTLIDGLYVPELSVPDQPHQIIHQSVVRWAIYTPFISCTTVWNY